MEKLIVFRKIYEYLFWLKPTIERFARVHRYSLGEQMHHTALDLLRAVIAANYAQTKRRHIERAIVEYETQRIFLRLAFEYKVISARQFEHASGRLSEIGRLLVGWRQKFAA